MEKTASAIGWMKLNLGKIRDFMPNEDKVFLPVCERKINIYERMVNDIFKDKMKKDIVSYKYFTTLEGSLFKAHHWKAQFIYKVHRLCAAK